MNAYNSYQVAALLTFASTGLLALFVLVKGGARTVPRLFGLYTLAISAWSFGWFEMISSNSYIQGLFWCRFLHLPATFIPTMFLSFVQHLLGVNNERKHILLRRLFYVVGLVFPIAAFSNKFIKTVIPKLGFRYYLEPGPYYLTFFIFFVSAVAITLVMLVLAYRVSNGFKKTQIGFVLTSYLLTYVGGTEVFLPAYNLSLPSVALYCVPLSHLLIAYAILTQRLMDITVIIRKTLIYSTVLGSLTLIYLAAITLFAHIFEGFAGNQTVFSSAIAAVLITICFQPLRKRVQAFVDRKFFRQYVDREEKLYELSREVITHTTPEAMADSLIRVLTDTLHPKSAALYLKARDGDGFLQVANQVNAEFPPQMSEDNPLANYFKDHPQPFVQEVPTEAGRSRDTRRPAARSKDAA